jgi:hypothetical protein
MSAHWRGCHQLNRSMGLAGTGAVSMTGGGLVHGVRYCMLQLGVCVWRPMLCAAAGTKPQAKDGIGGDTGCVQAHWHVCLLPGAAETLPREGFGCVAHTHVSRYCTSRPTLHAQRQCVCNVTCMVGVGMVAHSLSPGLGWPRLTACW